MASDEGRGQGGKDANRWFAAGGGGGREVLLLAGIEKVAAVP